MALLEKLPARLLNSPKVKSAVETAEGLSLNIIGARNVLIVDGKDGTFDVTTSAYIPNGRMAKTVTALAAKLADRDISVTIKNQTGLDEAAP